MATSVIAPPFRRRPSGGNPVAAAGGPAATGSGGLLRSPDQTQRPPISDRLFLAPVTPVAQRSATFASGATPLAAIAGSASRLEATGVDATPSHPQNCGTAPFYCPICMLHFPIVLEARCCRNLICGSCAKGIVETQLQRGARHPSSGSSTSAAAQRNQTNANPAWHTVILAATPARPSQPSEDAPPVAPSASNVAPAASVGSHGVRSEYVRSIMAATCAPLVSCPFCSRHLRVRVRRRSDDDDVSKVLQGDLEAKGGPIPVTPSSALKRQGPPAGCRHIVAVAAAADGPEPERSPPPPWSSLETPRDRSTTHHHASSDDSVNRSGMTDASESPPSDGDGGSLATQTASRPANGVASHHSSPHHHSKFAIKRLGALLQPSSTHAQSTDGLHFVRPPHTEPSQEAALLAAAAAHAASSPTKVGESFEDMRRKLKLFPLSSDYRRVEEPDVVRSDGDHGAANHRRLPHTRSTQEGRETTHPSGNPRGRVGVVVPLVAAANSGTVVVTSMSHDGTSEAAIALRPSRRRQPQQPQSQVARSLDDAKQRIVTGAATTAARNTNDASQQRRSTPSPPSQQRTAGSSPVAPPSEADGASHSWCPIM